MKTACTTAVVVALIAASAAQAQDSYGTYYGYHHRSTALGDWYAGAGDLVRAQGAYLKVEAAAAVTWLEVDRGREAFRADQGYRGDGLFEVLASRVTNGTEQHG